jgi:hypothetical protein
MANKLYDVRGWLDLDQLNAFVFVGVCRFIMVIRHQVDAREARRLHASSDSCAALAAVERI